MTYSVQNIHIDDSISFKTGLTAGSVLTVDALGSTSWTTPLKSNGPETINNFWSGSQAQYDGLGSYPTTTIYFIV
jgi:hypothetical protein